MLQAGIYHKASGRSLSSILSDGLRYGHHVECGRQDRIQQINEYLTALCPDRLRSVDLDRNASIYCYLSVDHHIFDVDTGLLIDESGWQVDQGMVRLQLTVDPQNVFVSDLEAFDELAGLAADTPESVAYQLAQQYWQHIVPLPDLCAHYRLEEHALVRRAEGPPRLPSRLERVEVLVTADISGGDVRLMR